MANVQRIYSFNSLTNVSSLAHINHVKAKDITEIKTQPHGNGNVVPFKHYLPAQDTEEYSKNKKELAYGWKELTPTFNILSKIFHIKNNEPVLAFIWIKERAKLYVKDPVPKNSIIYDHVRSTEHEKQVTLQVCEKILVDAYLQAKEFIANGKEVQPGFEISGDTSAIMKVKGAWGIEVNYKYVDALLESIRNEDVETVKNWKKFFRASFVHEMVHKLRGELYTEPDVAQEIAPHAVAILSTGGDNPLDDIYIKEELKQVEKDNRYQKDIAVALKIIQQKLVQNPACHYKPKSFELKEINRALMSIPKNIKKRTLKRMAQELTYTSGMNLLRVAAGVDKMQAKTQVAVATYSSKGTCSRGPG